MAAGDVMQWDHVIPGWVLVRGTALLLGRATLLCWAGIEVVTSLNHASATRYVVDAVRRGDVEVMAVGAAFGVMTIFALLVTATVYGGGATARFRITGDGVTVETLPAEPRNERIRRQFDLLAPPDAPAYTSPVAEKVSLSWSNLRRVIPDARHHRLALRNNRRTVIELYCTAENYEPVRAAVETHLDSRRLAARQR